MPALAAAIEALGVESSLARRRDRRHERRRRARLQRAAERDRQRRRARRSTTSCSTCRSSTAATCARCRCARAAPLLRETARRRSRSRPRPLQPELRRAAGADARGGAAAWGSKGIIAQARRCALRLGADRDLAEAEVPAAPGVRDRRLHRPRRRRAARSAACCSAITRTASCAYAGNVGTGWNAKTGARPARAAGRSSRSTSRRSMPSRSSPGAGRGAPPAASAGSSPSWSPRSRSPNGRPTATSARRCSRACALDKPARVR